MMIRVQYAGGNYDYVSPEMLDKKLITGEIKGFARSSGWAVVGKDPIRQSSRRRQYYVGPERRYKIN